MSLNCHSLIFFPFKSNLELLLIYCLQLYHFFYNFVHGNFRFLFRNDVRDIESQLQLWRVLTKIATSHGTHESLAECCIIVLSILNPTSVCCPRVGLKQTVFKLYLR